MRAKRRRPRRIALLLGLVAAAAGGAGAAAASASAAATATAATALPPPSRVDGGLRCPADLVLRPLSTRDVSRMLSELHAEASETGAPAGAVRVRATHSRFHTPSALVCPSGGAQQPPPQSQPQPANRASAPARSPGRFFGSATAVTTTASSQGADARSAVGTAAAEGDGAAAATTTTTTATAVQPTQQQQQQQQQQPRRVSLLTDALDAVLEVQPAPVRRMRVQAGMTIGQLLAAATAVNMSVPLGALPSFAGLTLGGALATAAHGSGPSTLADMVVAATWVDGTGKVHRTSSGTALEVEQDRGSGSGSGSGDDHSSSPLLSTRAGRALVGGLGLTGVVTELVLQLTPLTLTHALVALNAPDDTLAADVRDLLRVSPQATVVWRPDLRRYSAWVLRQETERDAERRRRRERRQWLAGEVGGGGGGGGGAGQEGDQQLTTTSTLVAPLSPEDARLSASPGVEAALPPAAARALLAWQRDTNLQGGPREEGAACAVARAAALGGAPFAYPPQSAAAMAKAAGERRGAAAAAADGGGSLFGLLSPLGPRRRRGGSAASSSPLQSQDAATGSGGARTSAASRLSLAFVGRTNDMAASACSDSAPSAAAAKRGAPSLCAWGGGGGGDGGGGAAAALGSSPDPPPPRAVRGSGFHLALELDDLEAWLDDARWALEADLQQDPAIPGGEGRCLPPGGFVLRFGSGLSDAAEAEAASSVSAASAAGGAEEDSSPDWEQQQQQQQQQQRSPTDPQMDLAAPPDPAQLEPRVPEEDARQLLPLPPALVLVVEAAAGSGGNSSANGTAAAAAAATTALSSSSPPPPAPRVIEVDEVSAAGLLSPASGLRRPVYVQALAATMMEEGERGQRGGGGGGGSSGNGNGSGAPPASSSSSSSSLPTPTTKYGWVLDALERFTLCAYPRAAPHWGDSAERALVTAAGSGAGAGGCPGRLRTRLPWFGEMLEAQREFDPLGMFEPEIFARVKRVAAAEEEEAQEEEKAGGRGEEGEADEDGCAASGRCYCRESRHCAPGFGCVESNAFAGVFVCKPWAVIAAMETGPAE
jgi:hypothetical protein